jgi:uncharacterized protein YecE (DUF72 family)
MPEQKSDLYFFRNIYPNVRLGTASDRYAGWIGQIYTEGKYQITTRSHKIGTKSFQEEILPIESVTEYFEHFSVLEIDFTFYRLLLDNDLEPTSNYNLLKSYQKFLNEKDYVILKVPQVIFARYLWQSGKQVENKNYLNAKMFINQFYDPANAIMGKNIAGFVFEQEYHRKAERIPPMQYVEELDNFFKSLPKDKRYHIETRTDFYHTHQYFDMLLNRGVGHVLSHWTWLPPLWKQFIKAKKSFYNSGRQSIIRLLTPLRMGYDDSYIKTFPFNKPVDEIKGPEMVNETVEIIKAAGTSGFTTNVILNNRVNGNAPTLAREIYQHFKIL